MCDHRNCFKRMSANFAPVLSGRWWPTGTQWPAVADRYSLAGGGRPVLCKHLVEFLRLDAGDELSLEDRPLTPHARAHAQRRFRYRWLPVRHKSDVIKMNSRIYSLTTVVYAIELINQSSGSKQMCSLLQLYYCIFLNKII